MAGDGTSEKAWSLGSPRLQDVLESISDGFFALDEDLRVLYMNDPALRLLGRRRDEVVSRPLFEAFPEAAGTIFDEKYRHALDTRERVHFETWFGVEPYTNWYDVRVYPMEGGISVFFQVTTPGKQAAQALAASQQRYRRLADALPDAVFVLDRDGRFLYANPVAAANSGFTADELIGRTEYDFQDPSQAQRHLTWVRQVLDTGEELSVCDDVQLQGRTLHFQTRLIPQTNDRGEVDSVLGVARDVTAAREAEQQQRQLESQIQHAQKLESLGVLAGGIAHDFNKGRFVVEPIDLSEVVREMGHMLEVSVSKKAVLKYNVAANLPAIRADATQIRQVVMNLITNASEAIGDRSGIISISTGAMDCDRQYLDETYLADDLVEGCYVSLEVADTGCGMDGETLARIFDPFFTTKFTGRGLGLAAVLGIVRGHGGALKVYSEPGKGTTFKILLPACADTASAALAGTAVPRIWRGSGNVVLADDEETVRTVGRRMLEALGFTVIPACDGAEVLEVLRHRLDEIRCVMLDLTMPHMDGEEAFREIRRLKADIPVIMCSGYNEQDVTQRFVGKGLAAFVQKPYTLNALSQALQSVLK